MKKKDYLYAITMIIISIMFILLMKLADCSWYAYMIYGAIFLLCIFLYKAKKLRKIYSYICITITLIILMLFVRTNINVSLIGTLTSNIIKIYMEGFDREKYYIVNEKPWKVPDGYTNHKYSLSESSLEILQKSNSSDNKHVVYQLHGGSYIRPIANEYRDLTVKYSKYADAGWNI